MMKKLLITLLTVIISLSFASCGNTSKKAKSTPKLTKKDFVGIWDGSAVIDSNGSYPKDYEKSKKVYSDNIGLILNYLEFEDENRASFYIMDKQYHGTWELKGNSIALTIEEAKQISEDESDLLQPGSVLKFEFDSDNTRILRKLDSGAMFVYEKK